MDNLLALHNTDAKTTTLYDIRQIRSAGEDPVVQPIADGLSIAPFAYEEKSLSLCTCRHTSCAVVRVRVRWCVCGGACAMVRVRVR